MAYCFQKANQLGKQASHQLDATFAESDGLATSLTQEVELRTTNNTLPFDVNLVDLGGMKWELSLNPFATYNPTDNEHFSRSAATLGNDSAAKNLDTFFVPFQDFGMNINHISNLECIDVGFHGGLFDEIKNLLAHNGTE